MAKLGTAAITWTDPGTGTERVVLLDVPLRALRPGFSQTAYTAQSLDRTSIATVTVGSGAHELVGVVRYEDDPQGLLDLVQAGATNTTLSYYPDLADPDQTYSVKLIEPRTLERLTLDLDSQRATFGEMQVELRFRQTDQTSFTELYDSTPVLFSYKAGGSLSGYTFTRADTATYVSKGYGTVTSATTGKARVTWFDTNSDGIRETPALLLEGASTNLIVESSNFGTTWTQTSVTATSGQSDPAGGTSAYLISDASAVAAGSVSITPTFTTDAVSKAISVFVKAGTATTTVINLRDTTAGADRLLMSLAWSNGVPTVTATTGTHIATVRHRDGWFRLLFRTTAVTVANTNTVFLYPAGTVVANTGTCYFYGVQAENALNPTSYIPTAGGTDARAADTLTVPFASRVQTLSIYLRFIQQGTWPWNSASGTVMLLGTAGAETRIAFTHVGGGGTIRMDIADTAGTVASGTITPGATHGQVVELLGTLTVTAATMTGTAQIQSAVNGTIGTASSVSTAKQVSDGFNGDVLALSPAGNAFMVPYTHFCIARGANSMLVMRRLARV